MITVAEAPKPVEPKSMVPRIDPRTLTTHNYLFDAEREAMVEATLPENKLRRGRRLSKTVRKNKVA